MSEKLRATPLPKKEDADGLFPHQERAGSSNGTLSCRMALVLKISFCHYMELNFYLCERDRKMMRNRGVR
ncbi:hypothetical protein ACI2JR_27035 [Klebsiella sp. NPDC088457]